MPSLEVLRNSAGENCRPSAESIAGLQASDLVLMSGQFVGAGKSTFIQTLVAQGRVNIASWTNRELRQGEVEGVDKIKASLDDMAQMATDGRFLELEEVRDGVFYATPAELAPGRKYVKDLELRGALRLRTFAPWLPIIVPLPPLDDEQGMEWERRVIAREGLDKGISDKALADIEGRLNGVVEEATRILEVGLSEDPRTLLVVNDDLPKALQITHHFLATGEKPPQYDINEHVKGLRKLATIALGAA